MAKINSKSNNDTKHTVSKGTFNYRFFLNCVKTGMNETRATVENTTLGNPYQ